MSSGLLQLRGLKLEHPEYWGRTSMSGVKVGKIKEKKQTRILKGIKRKQSLLTASGLQEVFPQASKIPHYDTIPKDLPTMSEWTPKSHVLNPHLPTFCGQIFVARVSSGKHSVLRK